MRGENDLLPDGVFFSARLFSDSISLFSATSRLIFSSVVVFEPVWLGTFDCIQCLLFFEIAKATAANYAGTQQIFNLRFKGGVVSSVEVEQVNSQVEQAQAAIPGLEQQVAAQENLIAVLLGRNPAPVARGKTIDELLAPRLPAGLPASLLERRPDILQAEQNLVAANANIGVAQSLYYPQISLTGLLGSARAALGDFLSSASFTWGVAAALTGPIFTFGAIEGQVAGTEAAQFFKGSNKQGFDYYSFHFALRNTNKTIKDFIVGDYNLSFGQGLIIHSGFGVGKSPWATNIRKAERTIRPYNSVNESNFLRGFASNININKHTEETMIFSVRKKDGNSVTDSLDLESIFSSFQESGYHRTINEISDENALTETMIGGAVKYKGQYGHIGINSLFTSFNKDFRKQDVPYNQFSFRGTDLFQASMDHSFQLRNFHLFGEAAISNPGTYALMEGLQLSLDKKLDISFLYRKLDKSYPALYSNAFSENTLANNETGFYIGMEMRPTSRWKVSGYW